MFITLLSSFNLCANIFFGKRYFLLKNENQYKQLQRTVLNLDDTQLAEGAGLLQNMAPLPRLEQEGGAEQGASAGHENRESVLQNLLQRDQQ